MSLLPLIVSFTDDHDHNDPWTNFSQWNHPLFQLMAPQQQQLRTSGGYRRNWPCAPSVCAQRKKCSEQLPLSTIGKDGFQVCVDVQQFLPNEITVKTVDNSVVIEAKHEEKEDNQGYVSRHFVRRYTLPEGFDAQQVVSSLSSDGVLTVKAPPPTPKEIQGQERVVQIQQTGPVHLSVKPNEVKLQGNGEQPLQKE